MKGTSLRLALTAGLLMVAIPVFAQAKNAGKQSLKAKIQYCKDCHGLQGQGFLGAYPVPRIAGQTVRYLKDKSKIIMKRKRTNPTDTLMAPPLHSVKPKLRKKVYEYFSKLNPPPAAPGPKKLMAEGKEIFDKGSKKDDLPPCADCHGKEAEGDSKYPRLAGQIYPYLVRMLTEWPNIVKDRKRGRVVKKGAHTLTKEQIKAVSAYASNLR
jgi:cytochrome c553